ncbi:MAG: anthranilate phosphoribosyltransferase [Oscillospiraceae bacterium]
MKKYIFKVIDGENLTENEAFSAMDCIMSDKATNSQIASFITALRMKGETIDEITGFAKVMRKKAKVVKESTSAIDIVGTGGDMANTFNISTTAAFVIAGAGIKVAKHGNRSVSSKSGAADVLEKLGVKFNPSSEEASLCLKECGLSFLFAQNFHCSMKFAAAPRREIGVRSVFNILGPLSNPALADYILLGVYDGALMETMARVLINLGIKGAMLVYGKDGLDEITVSDRTEVCEIRDGKIIKYEINPLDYGIELSKKSELTGGEASENAEITLEVLSGEKGAKRDIVLMNAGCAIYVAGAAKTIAEGIKMAEISIDSKKALGVLEKLVAFTNSEEKKYVS